MVDFGLVSIVMPSYNTGKYICPSIESVQKQTYSNWELLIVDDCSSDDTEQLVGQYLSDSRIRFIKNEKNRRSGIPEQSLAGSAGKMDCLFG